MHRGKKGHLDEAVRIPHDDQLNPADAPRRITGLNILFGRSRSVGRGDRSVSAAHGQFKPDLAKHSNLGTAANKPSPFDEAIVACRSALSS